MPTSKKPEGNSEQAPPEPRRAHAGDRVGYVLDRGYSAGEAPEIVKARISHVHDSDEGIVDLVVGSGDGAVTKTSRRYSEGREVGTWHWLPKK